MKNSRSQPAILFIALLGALVGIYGAAWFEISLPGCALRKLTGIPCPFCGGTRALFACTRFEWVKAFQFNPLAVLGCIGIFSWFAIWLLDCCLKRSWANALQNRVRSICSFPLVLTVVFLNWCYLCWWMVWH